MVLRLKLQSWEVDVVIAHHWNELVDSLSYITNVTVDRTTVCPVPDNWLTELASKVHFNEDTSI